MGKTIKELLASETPIEQVSVAGWVRTRRDGKTCSFIEINDGSCVASLQIVVEQSCSGYEMLKKILTGSSIRVEGALVPSPAPKQKWELHAKQIRLIGPADSTYPLQKKGHSLEFLRTIAHLRPRSNLFGVVFRFRSKIALAVHEFFQKRQFIYVHTPIITTNDCEGAGRMFRVTTLSGNIDLAPEKDFFGKPAYLTVSGQLEAEALACALGKVYTFGPTFRAENSNTSRHAAEFWMIEPEAAFYDLESDMTLAEEFIRSIAQFCLENCKEELEYFAQRVDPQVYQRLTVVATKPVTRIPYNEAIGILQKSGRNFEFPPTYGENLQAEHEKYLTEVYFKGPVTVFNFPRAIKPFYMRLNDDNETVAAMDVLVPEVGEIIGGSQREERLETLLENMKYHGLKERDYWWYVDLRRYGTVPHAGFGVGFERLLMFLSGIQNIRDVIPFPRTPGNAEF